MSSSNMPFIFLAGMVKWKISLLVLFLLSCQPLPKKPDIPIIRRPNWWNFYQRGIAYSLRNEWEKAADDLAVAIGSEPGAIYPEFEEKRRAKTYGLHFLNGYFPHRELGICFYYRKMYEEAEKELELSLKMLPSSRAKLYLNKAKEALYAKLSQKIPDSVRFDFDATPTPFYTNQPFYRLKGRVSSPYRISRLSVNDHPVFIELAEEEIELKKRLPLTAGKHKISIRARDLAGNEGVWNQEIIVDISGPSVSFSPSTDDPENFVKVVVIDNLEIRALSIEGKTIELPKGKKTYEHQLKLTPKRTIQIEALDKVKNRTILKSTTDDLLKADIQTRRYHPDRRLASTMSSKIPPPAKTPDTLPPRLKIFPEVAEYILVTSETYLLDVEVIDSGYVDSVTFIVNDQQETRELHELKLIKHRFTQTVELNPSENKVKIVVRDRVGNTRSKAFTIERKMDYRWREDFRISAQLLPPDSSRVPHLKPMDLYSMFLEAMLRLPRRFNIVERDPEVMQRLLIEFKLAESKLGDQLNAVKLGKLTPSDWLLRGYVTKWAGIENWDFVIDLVDVATGEYILTTDIHFTGLALDHVKFQLSGLAEKINQQLPKLSATVSEIKTNGIKIPLGQQHNILKNMRFIFISAEEQDFDFGDPKTFQDQWIQGTVKRVTLESCLVEIFPEKALDHVNIRDWAILR